MTDLETILIVDDQENFLSALKRQLGRSYNVLTATSGELALDLIKTGGPVAVCICDMQMPGMNGLEVLKSVSAQAPETVRIMLTGNVDQQTAADAINSGEIFRFFNKPCDQEALIKGIDAGITHYRLVTSERDLLEQTLAGSVKLLSDLTSHMDSTIGNDAHKMRSWAQTLSIHMKLQRSWELDLSCMLAPIGRLAIPSELREKNWRGEILTAAEQAIFDREPEIARDLIANIPRMSEIANAVYFQNKNFDGSGFPVNETSGKEIPLLGRLLHVLKGIAERTNYWMPTPAVFDNMDMEEKIFDPEIVAHARACLATDEDNSESVSMGVIEKLPVSLLRVGQEIRENITSKDGRLLLRKGTVLSKIHIERLKALVESVSINEPIRTVTYH